MQSNPQKKIGLFGGSFDPPHCGHVALVQAGLGMGLDSVWVIPARPVHRELSGLADAGMRLDWIKQIFADQRRVQVVDWEIRRQRPTASIETLQQFHAAYPDTVPWLMLGADAWAGLPGWRGYPAHRNLCNIVVFARRSIAVETVCGHAGWKRRTLDDMHQCHQAGNWTYIQADLPDISATRIRSDAMQAKPLHGLVPEIIQQQIEQAYGRARE